MAAYIHSTWQIEVRSKRQMNHYRFIDLLKRHATRWYPTALQAVQAFAEAYQANSFLPYEPWED